MSSYAKYTPSSRHGSASFCMCVCLCAPFLFSLYAYGARAHKPSQSPADGRGLFLRLGVLPQWLLVGQSFLDSRLTSAQRSSPRLALFWLVLLCFVPYHIGSPRLVSSRLSSRHIAWAALNVINLFGLLSAASNRLRLLFGCTRRNR